jgi:hypothetical protein
LVHQSGRPHPAAKRQVDPPDLLFIFSLPAVILRSV